MKYIKSFEKSVKTLNKINVGDIVICINPDNNDMLTLGDKYIITRDAGWNLQVLHQNIQITDPKDDRRLGYWSKTRFIKPEDYEKWKLERNVNKYNI